MKFPELSIRAAADERLVGGYIESTEILMALVMVFPVLALGCRG